MLFYCDPPYYKTEKMYDIGGCCFGKEQHILLRDMLKNIKGKFSNGEIGLPMKGSKIILPCGIYGRWEK